jgi:hypothetical protein
MRSHRVGQSTVQHASLLSNRRAALSNAASLHSPSLSQAPASFGPGPRFNFLFQFKFSNSIQTPVAFQNSFKFKILFKFYEINYVIQ